MNILTIISNNIKYVVFVDRVQAVVSYIGVSTKVAINDVCKREAKRKYYENNDEKTDDDKEGGYGSDEQNVVRMAQRRQQRNISYN